MICSNLSSALYTVSFAESVRRFFIFILTTEPLRPERLYSALSTTIGSLPTMMTLPARTSCAVFIIYCPSIFKARILPISLEKSSRFNARLFSANCRDQSCAWRSSSPRSVIKAGHACPEPVEAACPVALNPSRPPQPPSPLVRGRTRGGECAAPPDKGGSRGVWVFRSPLFHALHKSCTAWLADRLSCSLYRFRKALSFFKCTASCCG